MELHIIQSKIYEIRGVRVMLDFDLAALYQVTTGNLNKAVKRNVERFPERFMFQLTKEEVLKFQSVTLDVGSDADRLIFQTGTSSWGGTRKLPYAFTEQGVSMLSAVLRSDVAVRVSISIMDAFVAVRNYLSSTATLSAELSEIRTKLRLLEHNDEDTLEAVNDLSEDLRKDIDNIYLAIGELSIKAPKASRPRNLIGYNVDRDKKGNE